MVRLLPYLMLFPPLVVQKWPGPWTTRLPSNWGHLHIGVRKSKDTAFTVFGYKFHKLMEDDMTKANNMPTLFKGTRFLQLHTEAYSKSPSNSRSVS